MRQLRIVVRSTRGALPLVVAAAVVPSAVSGCGTLEATGSASQPPSEPDASGGAGGTAVVTVGSIVGTGGFGGSTGGTAGGDGGVERYCPPLSYEETHIVSIPPAGVPADPGQICSATVEPVESNRAARVTLVAESADLHAAAGFIDVDAALLPRVLGLPTIEVIDATHPELKQIEVSMVTAQPSGFSFEARWPASFYLRLDALERMTMRVSLELECTVEMTRVVHAVTDIHLCGIGPDYMKPTWVSSGDRCTVCSIIAEMAPSPIVPDKGADGLPLARALRLRIVELARISNAVVLLAENDGGDAIEYEWHPSIGKIERLAADVVLWTLEEGMAAPFIQASIWDLAGAAVATWAFNDEAA